MPLARFVAVILLLQGIAPALLAGAARPGGAFLLGVALLYAILAWGLWGARRWALPLAFLLTLPQAVIVSTPLLSWQFFVSATFGLGFASAPSLRQVPIFFSQAVGARLDAAIFEPCPTLLASYRGIPSPSFLIFNLLAVPPLVFLIVLTAKQRRLYAPPPRLESNPALERTPTAGDAGSGDDAHRPQ